MEEFSDVRFKQRAFIEFLTAEKVSPIQIHRRMQAIYGDLCVDVSTVRCWVRRFKDGELRQADLSDKTRRTDFKNSTRPSSYFRNNQITEEWRGGACSIRIGNKNNILMGTRELMRPFA